jgi:CheY-like chemotaxis protein
LAQRKDASEYAAAEAQRQQLEEQELSVLLLLPEQDAGEQQSAGGEHPYYRTTAIRTGAANVEDLAGTADLVLAEQQIASSPGNGQPSLLRRLVASQSHRRLPVVLMADENTPEQEVLHALTEGAADVQIKPIRRNEVATLWQHVWRAQADRWGRSK